MFELHDSCVTLWSNCSQFICLVPDVMVGMGFTREEVRESLINHKYNDVTATYLLLARKNEVSESAQHFIYLFCLFVFNHRMKKYCIIGAGYI